MQIRKLTTEKKIKKAIELLASRLTVVQHIDKETDEILNSLSYKSIATAEPNFETQE